MTKYRLLIVDDEDLIRQGLCARIQSFHLENLEIDEAGSAKRALEKFAAERIDLALVDISMPEMNGLELIEQAKKISPNTQFILLSGYAEFSYAQRAIQLRVRAYLNKPVSNEMLREQLENALHDLRSREKREGQRNPRLDSDLEKELNLLLSGSVLREKVQSACPELHRQYPKLFSGDAQAYLAVLHISRREEERMNALRPMVREVFEEASCDGERLIVNSYQNPQRLYAIFLDDDGRNLRRRLEKVFLSVHPELEKRGIKCVTMGVSLMTNRIGAQAADEAHEALRQRYVQGRSNIYFYEDLAAMEPQSFPEAELELLRKCMEREDREGVHRQLEKLFSDQQMQGRRAVDLHVLWVRIVGMTMRMYSDMDSVMVNRLLSQLSRVDAMAYRDDARMLAELIDDCIKRRSGREMNTSKKIGYAMAYIREHFNEEIIINDLAAKLDMSPGYFSSSFKKEVGQSTMQYVTGLRVERAKEYLADTQLSVAVIARNVGYADGQYFYRVFKKITGMTPIQYRQGLRKS